MRVEKTRIEYIDIAKGIGIILVFLGHIIPPGNVIRNFIFLFHMPLFFIISGFLFNEKRHIWKSFIVSRAKSILIPCYCFGSLAVVAELITNETYSLDALLYGLPNVFWFLPVLFISELLVFFLWKIFSNNILRIFLFVCLLLLGLLSINNSILRIYHISLVPICSAFYAFGNLFCKKIKISNSLGGAIASLILLLLFVYAYYSEEITNLDHFQLANGWIGFVLGVLGSVAILWIGMFLELFHNPMTKFIQYCGRNSLIIYALHISLMQIIVYVLLPIKPLFGPIKYHLCFVVELLICVILLSMTIKLVNNKLKWIIGKF